MTSRQLLADLGLALALAAPTLALAEPIQDDGVIEQASVPAGAIYLAERHEEARPSAPRALLG